MKRLLLPLLAAIALPTAVNAELTKKEKIETCALFAAGQIPHEYVADEFGLKKPLGTLGSKKPLRRAVRNYCYYINGIQPGYHTH